jgi:hypothetical protein
VTQCGRDFHGALPSEEFKRKYRAPGGRAIMDEAERRGLLGPRSRLTIAGPEGYRG